MTTKQGYEVNGQVATSLEKVAELLGVSRVYRKDVISGGQYADQVNLCELDEGEATDTIGDEVTNESATGMEVEGSVCEPTDAVESADVVAGEAATAAPVQAEEPSAPTPVSVAASASGLMSLEEAKKTFPTFGSLEDLKAFIVDMDTETLEYMASNLRCTWKPTDHVAINRMRVAQSLHQHYFPELFQPKEGKKKKAKYGDHTTEQLFLMISEHHLKVDRSGHEPIDRMRAIMALKEAGHLPA